MLEVRKLSTLPSQQMQALSHTTASPPVSPTQELACRAEF